MRRSRCLHRTWETPPPRPSPAAPSRSVDTRGDRRQWDRGGMAADQTEERAARDEVRAWLGERWRPGLDQRSWREACVDAGWSVPTWPTRWYGRGWDRALSVVVAEEFARAGAPFGGLDTQYGHQPIELQIGGTVIVTFATDPLKERMLRPILLGERRGCLLYSEPGAGSDL